MPKHKHIIITMLQSINQSQLLASQINFDVFHQTGVHRFPKGVDLVSGRELVQLKKGRKKKREAETLSSGKGAKVSLAGGGWLRGKQKNKTDRPRRSYLPLSIDSFYFTFYFLGFLVDDGAQALELHI